MKIAVFAGDGIGPEVTREAVRVLEALDLPELVLFEGDVGGAAYKRHGHPLPAETLAIARSCDAILFGAVGDPECDHLDRHLRPDDLREQALEEPAEREGEGEAHDVEREDLAPHGLVDLELHRGTAREQIQSVKRCGYCNSLNFRTQSDKF